jgi:hypothetical protein
MTQDVDLLARDPGQVAAELAQYLNAELQIAARVRELKPGVGYRVYQARSEGARHLADVRRPDMNLNDVVN